MPPGHRSADGDRDDDSDRASHSGRGSGGESRDWRQQVWHDDDRREWDPGNYGGLDRERGPGQSRQGPHRGKGPKDYIRPDERIREDVCERLSDHDMVDASEIAVTVSGGEVVLDGFVATRRERRAAEDCAESCSGIVHVQNNLRISQSARSVAAPAGGKVG